MVIACIKRALQLACIKRALQLRDLTSIELFKNQEFYAFHPLLRISPICLHLHENTTFSAAASDFALGDAYERNNPSSRAAVVRGEAICNTYAFASSYATPVGTLFTINFCLD